MEKSSKGIIKSVITYILFALLGLFIVLIVLLSAFPNVSMNVLKFNAYVAKYTDMEPTINAHDLVFVKYVDPASIQSGDLIAFEGDVNFDGTTEIMTYYFDHMSDDGKLYYLYAKNHTNSVIVVSNATIGEYMFRIPKFGYVIEFVSSIYGIAIIVVNALIIALVVFLVKNSKEDKHKNED